MIDIAATSALIIEAFELLGKRQLEPQSLDARRVPGRSDALVAVSYAGEPALLLAVGAETVLEERHLSAVRVLSGDDFSVIESSTGDQLCQRFAVVLLRSGHEDLTSSFALLSATLLATLAETPSANDIITFVDSLVRLLAQSRTVSPNAVLGLWGELWLIQQQPTAFASAWHRDKNDRFDFSFESHRVELKTTALAGRLHEFALEQLESDTEKPTWIASLRTVSDASGKTIVDLLDAIIADLPRKLASHVSAIALETLAGDIEAASDYSFAPVGEHPLNLYNADDIPRVIVPEGAGISAVRFRIDLDRISPLAPSTTGAIELILSGSSREPS